MKLKSYKNCILGSGLSALICKKILGDNWSIVPLGPSRFYSEQVPAWGDDFVIYDDKIFELIKDWGLRTDPLFFNRPFSVGGELLYNDAFIDVYFNKMGIEDTPQNRDYYKTTFTVFGFSCIQLWNKLLPDCIPDIKEFYNIHQNAKKILSIKDHKIALNNGDVIEFDNLISTIPYNVLCEMMGYQFTGEFSDLYCYFIQDNNIDIEKANQVLIGDLDIPFHKCSKLGRDKYMFEVVDHYIDDVYKIFGPVLGYDFNVLKATMIENGFPRHYKLDNDMLTENGITCIGSYAQCDPLMDIGSVVKRTYNLLNKNIVIQ